MKDWYLRQSPRDRIIVIAVGVLCLIGGLYAFVWEPLQTGLESRERNIANLERDRQYMLEGEAVIKQGGQSAGIDQSKLNTAPYLLIDEEIRKAKIGSPERVEPTGKDGARVTFGLVEFDKLVVVIAQLEKYGLKVSQMNIGEKDAGMVSVRFTMERS